MKVCGWSIRPIIIRSSSEDESDENDHEIEQSEDSDDIIVISDDENELDLGPKVEMEVDDREIDDDDRPLDQLVGPGIPGPIEISDSDDSDVPMGTDNDGNNSDIDLDRVRWDSGSSEDSETSFDRDPRFDNPMIPG